MVSLAEQVPGQAFSSHIEPSTLVQISALVHECSSNGPRLVWLTAQGRPATLVFPHLASSMPWPNLTNAHANIRSTRRTTRRETGRRMTGRCGIVGMSPSGSARRPSLLASVDAPLERFVADGMYDNATVYDALAAHQGGAAIDIVVPPRRTAAPSPTAQSAPTQRDQHITDIQSEGAFEWRRASGDYAQAHVENTFYRYKAIIGGHLRAKRADSQQREAQLGCAILNRLRQIGRPASVPSK